MRAMVADRYGGPEVLALREVDRPTPGPGQLLVRVVGHAVNPVDWKRVSGKYWPLVTVRFPYVPGFDVSGEVAALGPGVTEYAVGDRVYGRITKPDGGACADYARIGTDVVAPAPAGLDLADAASLPLAGMTALQGLRDELGVPMTGAAERILVVGASGGVGHLAVQIARAAGATVVGVCSGKNADFVRDLGAHETIDYTQPDAFAGQAPFDVIYDCVGGPIAPWMARLTPTGRFASALPGPAVFARSWLNPVTTRRARPVMLSSNTADLRVLSGLVAAGKLRVAIDSRFPLERLADAWARSINGRARGKILVTV